MALELTVPAARKIGPVTRTDFVRFAGAGGDFNPVHHDDEYARKLGFPSVFAMGMFPAGLVGAFVSDWVGPGEVAQLDIRFVAPTWPGDALVVTADNLVAEADGGSADFSVTAAGEPRLTGAVAFGSARLDRPAAPPEPEDPRLRQIKATRLEPVEFPVERGKILEYSRAVRAGELHLDPEKARQAGFADLPAPPTYTVCVAHWSGGDATAVPRTVGLDLARVLHAEQRYTFHRPVVAGQTLRGERAVSAVQTKQSRSGGQMTFVTVTTRFVDSAGDPVVDEDMVMLERTPQPR
ncbi:MAG TPA: MaoC family dehydratase N-terminal domain-containing protein [Amycolatopsis sp.]|nr:MaoC family dehydratase N-terminal domain-containing protein [Amycolatopsis sp.]